MVYRLVATIDGRRERFTLHPGEQVLGSHSDCALRLAHATVSRRHALIKVGGEGVVIEDLGSRNGIRLASEKVAQVTLGPGVEVRIGAIPVVLEEVPDHDLEAAVLLEDGAGANPGMERVEDRTTYASGPAERFVVEALPRLLDRVAEGVGFEAAAQLVGETLFEVLPCVEAVVLAAGEEDDGVLFKARRSESSCAEERPVSARIGDAELRLTMPNSALAEGARPLVEAAAAIVRLAGARDRAPAAALDTPPPPPLPDPPTVVPAVRSIYADAARVARGDVGVLILGESGTGKEVLARYVHRASQRVAGPFLGLDCAALPRDLLEAELFGIEKGVATGVDERPGKFELATGGTLFLDEIGDMAEETQAKLLRILQSGECYRLGSSRPRVVDVRIVAATNRDVRQMLAVGSFRSDLYHRIATWVVEIPPLRRRRADIANLAAYFLAREAAKRGLRVKGISLAAVEALEGFYWPGNIRQLEHEMARAVLFLEDGELLDSGRLAEEVRRPGATASGTTLREILEITERREINFTLDGTDGNVDLAAEQLGVSRATLYRRMKALGIDTASAD